MLVQLEERGLIENLGEATSNLVARADEVCLYRAVELALAEVVPPTLVLLSLLRCASVVSLSNSCRVDEQHGGATDELGADGIEEMAEKVAEEGAPLGSNTTGCSLSLTGTGGIFEKTRAPRRWSFARRCSRCALSTSHRQMTTPTGPRSIDELMVMDDADGDDNDAAAPGVAEGMETDSDSDSTAPAAGMDGTIASRVRRHGAPRPVLPKTTLAFNLPRGVLHTRTVPA
eukprot:3757836-Pleurochrysis_carterae.AAC.4